jgi:ArsR family transcriptional regulator
MPFMQIEAVFRALGDGTRLRIMRLLGSMELAVGEIAQVLGQSQPRVSRHIGILCDCGLVKRRREGSWIFLRAAGLADGLDDNQARGTHLAARLAELLAKAEEADPEFAAQCNQDRDRLSQIRANRAQMAESYFAEHAENWDELRQLHSSDEAVETALSGALPGGIGRMLDVGTGTGRMAELFAGKADHIIALDRSLAMLKVARAKLQSLPAEQLELVQGDFSSLPFDDASFDTVLFHQVLHFAADPGEALAQAGRVTRSGGRVAIVDFAAHGHEELRAKHAHARLGFSDETMAGFLSDAGFLGGDPLTLEDGELAVKIWVAERLPDAAAPLAAKN